LPREISALRLFGRTVRASAYAATSSAADVHAISNISGITVGGSLLADAVIGTGKTITAAELTGRWAFKARSPPARRLAA